MCIYTNNMCVCMYIHTQLYVFTPKLALLMLRRESCCSHRYLYVFVSIHAYNACVCMYIHTYVYMYSY